MPTISESKVIQRLEELLEAIDEPARDRVLAWANSRWSKPVETVELRTVEHFGETLPTIGGVTVGKDVRRG